MPGAFQRSAFNPQAFFATPSPAVGNRFAQWRPLLEPVHGELSYKTAPHAARIEASSSDERLMAALRRIGVL